MRETKVLLKGVVVIVKHVAVGFAAQVTRQMHLVQMFMEDSGVKEELLAEITPRMRKDFGTTITGWVAMFNMIAELLHVIYPLLPDKDSASLETHQTEGLLM